MIEFPYTATSTIDTTTRVESTTPSCYRLGRKPDGTLVLQGLYFWHQGRTTGYVWSDIETVDVA